METPELQERQHAWWWWPSDAMACSSSGSGSESDRCCLQLEWDPRLVRYFGGLGGMLGVAAGCHPDGHRAVEHELGLFFPKCMERPGSSSSAPPQEDAIVFPDDQWDELVRCFGGLVEEEEQLVGFTSSCISKETTTTATSFVGGNELLALTSASSLVEPTLAAAREPQQPPVGSPSSHCDADQQRQTSRANVNRSSKRSATQETPDGRSGKRSRKAGPSVVLPFAVVKPGPRGVDGVETLADINERILTTPAWPVRHPVGEFACPPRASAGGDRPAPSGKAVVGFTRLHTAGKGTITIIRSSG